MQDTDPIIRKAGLQDPDDPWTFVLSTDTKDSYGDIVEQDWKLSIFRRNPIALWMHNSKEPIGIWQQVRVIDGKLRGRLKLAEKGTSELIDRLRSLVEQRVLRAVSVGFRSGKAEPLDQNDPWAGYRLTENTLHECSLVTVPANYEALNTASADLRRAYAVVSDSRVWQSESACAQLSRASGFTKPQPIQRKDKMPTLAQQIEQVKERIVSYEDALTQLSGQIGTDGDVGDEVSDQIDATTEMLDSAKRNLERLERMEAVMLRGKPAGDPDPAPAKDPSNSPMKEVTSETKSEKSRSEKSRQPYIHLRTNRPPGYRVFGAISAMIMGHVRKQDPRDIIQREFNRDDARELEILVRAATAPATTTGADWASELTREAWGEFVELLRDRSVYVNLPGLRMDLTEQIHNFPVQNGRGALAGGFVAENGAIPVKEGVIGTTTLQPKKMGVISAFTREVARRSTPSIISVVQNQILDDTSEAIDTHILGTGARDTTQPAGFQDPTETGAANVVAITGGTVSDILSDTRALLGRVWAEKAGGNSQDGLWVMHPSQRLALEDKQDGTTGEFAFRDAIGRNMFRGFPIFESTNVTDGITVFIDRRAVYFGEEYAPMLEMTDSATLHFEDTDPDQIGTPGSPNVVAAPVINLWQQDAMAVKMVWGMDYRIVRKGALQVLTGTTGW